MPSKLHSSNNVVIPLSMYLGSNADNIKIASLCRNTYLRKAVTVTAGSSVAQLLPDQPSRFLELPSKNGQQQTDRLCQGTLHILKHKDEKVNPFFSKFKKADLVFSTSD